MPVDLSAEQAELRLLSEYKSKLKLPNETIMPDPFTLDNGWLGEKDGMVKWPSLYIMDITQYLNIRTPKDIIHRLLNEYKEGKAYRYFHSDWVKEIFFHPFCARSDFCILKARVTPSQSIRNKEYDAWIIIKKDGENAPGGQIMSAYCTCTAGMLGCCNHIAGVLFRIEHAVKIGATKTFCTSELCQWNVPNTKTTVKPMKVSDADWSKSHYTKHSACIKGVNSASGNSIQTKRILKQNFSPLTKEPSSDTHGLLLLRLNPVGHNVKFPA